jgi:hypothetical protein
MNDVFVPNELPDILAGCFTIDSVLDRKDLNSDQKLGYLQGIQEIINFMRMCVEERGS